MWEAIQRIEKLANMPEFNFSDLEDDLKEALKEMDVGYVQKLYWPLPSDAWAYHESQPSPSETLSWWHHFGVLFRRALRRPIVPAHELHGR